jgi:hypothetical protein
MKKKLFSLLLLSIPMVLLAQNPGDNPDARPQDVPFDGTMSWILIVAGLVLSVFILRKSFNKKVSAAK